MNRFSIS